MRIIVNGVMLMEHVCVPHMVKSGFNEEQARSYMKNMLPNLKYWKNHDYLSDGGKFEAFKKELIEEINDLHIKGMPKVESLNALIGSYVNLEYPLPSGIKAKFLNDQITYLGTKLESDNIYYGVVANADYILVCTYEEEGKNPNLLLFKKR